MALRLTHKTTRTHFIHSSQGCLSVPCDCLPIVCHVRCAHDCVVICSQGKPTSQPSNKLSPCTCRFQLPISSARHILISTSVPFSQGGNAKISGLLKCLYCNVKDAQPIKHAFHSQSLRVRGNAGWQVDAPFVA